MRAEMPARVCECGWQRCHAVPGIPQVKPYFDWRAREEGIGGQQGMMATWGLSFVRSPTRPLMHGKCAGEGGMEATCAGRASCTARCCARSAAAWMDGRRMCPDVHPRCPPTTNQGHWGCAR
eukprot:XP_001694352.1 predicted protein [Chlamydomonas reinhardtii]